MVDLIRRAKRSKEIETRKIRIIKMMLILQIRLLLKK